MSISNIKSTSIKLSYTDIASIAAKQDGYNAGLAVFVDTTKTGTEHKIRVVQWDDHPTDPTKSVLSRLEWVVPSTVTMADSIACKQAIATMIRALKELRVEGIKTTVPLHLEVLSNTAFHEAQVDTTFVERMVAG